MADAGSGELDPDRPIDPGRGLADGEPRQGQAPGGGDGPDHAAQAGGENHGPPERIPDNVIAVLDRLRDAAAAHDEN